LDIPTEWSNKLFGFTMFFTHRIVDISWIMMIYPSQIQVLH
jgi:hypothetical protein